MCLSSGAEDNVTTKHIHSLGMNEEEACQSVQPQSLYKFIIPRLMTRSVTTGKQNNFCQAWQVQKIASDLTKAPFSS